MCNFRKIQSTENITRRARARSSSPYALAPEKANKKVPFGYPVRQDGSIRVHFPSGGARRAARGDGRALAPPNAQVLAQARGGARN